MSGLASLIAELGQLRAGLCPACGQPLPPDRARPVTCSDVCHQRWIDTLIARYGETSEIRHLETDKVYLVPTRVILERGITGADLHHYPEKGRPSITCPVCQRTSYNPHDIAHRYCGCCHRFLDDPVPRGTSQTSEKSQT